MMKSLLFSCLASVSLLACSDSNTPSQTGEGTASEGSSDAKKSKAKATQSSTSKSSGKTLTDAEYDLLESHLEDIRAGVREYASDAVGVCKGDPKDCEATDFLGLDAGELPEGKYSVGAEFQVPYLKTGDGWLVTFEVNCTITKKTKNSESKTNKNRSKDYHVTYVSASSSHGYRLAPVHQMTSPSSSGHEECEYSFTAQNLDGPKVWKGSYSIPYKGK